VVTNTARIFIYSKFYTAFCIFIIVINLALLIWELIAISTSGGFPSSPGFVFLEVVVNLSLLIEIILRVLAMGKKYWNYWGNYFDCFVLLLSLVAMSLYFAGDSVFKEIEEGFALALLICRYIIAILRVGVIVKNQSNTLSAGIARVEIPQDEEQLAKEEFMGSKNPSEKFKAEKHVELDSIRDEDSNEEESDNDQEDEDESIT